jgi:hypothetical protein
MLFSSFETCAWSDLGYLYRAMSIGIVFGDPCMGSVPQNFFECFCAPRGGAKGENKGEDWTRTSPLFRPNLRPWPRGLIGRRPSVHKTSTFCDLAFESQSFFKINGTLYHTGSMRCWKYMSTFVRSQRFYVLPQFMQDGVVCDIQATSAEDQESSTHSPLRQRWASTFDVQPLQRLQRVSARTSPDTA